MAAGEHLEIWCAAGIHKIRHPKDLPCQQCVPTAQPDPTGRRVLKYNCSRCGYPWLGADDEQHGAHWRAGRCGHLVKVNCTGQVLSKWCACPVDGPIVTVDLVHKDGTPCQVPLADGTPCTPAAPALAPAASLLPWVELAPTLGRLSCRNCGTTKLGDAWTQEEPLLWELAVAEWEDEHAGCLFPQEGT